MRRFLGPVLLGVGVFLVVLAGLLKFFVADRVILTPIDQYAQTTSLGPGSFLDPAALQVRSADLVAVRTLKGDVAASTKDTAVWDVSVVLSTGDGQLVRASVDRVATDRRTAEAVNCCGEAVDSTPTRHTGVSYKFPFDTQKQDYKFWDPNAKKAATARYVSEETVQGLTTYKFISTIAATQIQTQEVPGSLVGETAPSVQAPVYYADTRTVWVEPKTGVIVKGSEQNLTTLRDSAGQDKTKVLQFDLTFNERDPAQPGPAGPGQHRQDRPADHLAAADRPAGRHRAHRRRTDHHGLGGPRRGPADRGAGAGRDAAGMSSAPVPSVPGAMVAPLGGECAMSGVRVLVGTRKGAFVLSADGARERLGRRRPPVRGLGDLPHPARRPTPTGCTRRRRAAGSDSRSSAREDGGASWEQVGDRFEYDGVPGTHQWYDGTPHPWEFARVWHLEPSPTDPGHGLRRRRGRRAVPHHGRRQGVEGAARPARPRLGPEVAAGRRRDVPAHDPARPRRPAADLRRDLRGRRVPLRRRRRDLAADQPWPALGRHPRPGRGGRPLRAPDRHAPVSAGRAVHAEALGRHAQRRRRRLLARDQRRPAERLRLPDRGAPARAGHGLRRADHQRLLPLPAGRPAAGLPEPHRRRRLGAADRRACPSSTAT